MIRRPPRSTPLYSSAASDVYKRQEYLLCRSLWHWGLGCHYWPVASAARRRVAYGYTVQIVWEAGSVQLLHVWCAFPCLAARRWLRWPGLQSLLWVYYGSNHAGLGWYLRPCCWLHGLYAACRQCTSCCRKSKPIAGIYIYMKMRFP